MRASSCWHPPATARRPPKPTRGHSSPRRLVCGLAAVWLALVASASCLPAAESSAVALRLVPFPKELSLEEGSFPLNQPLVLAVPADAHGPLVATIVDEFRRAGLPQPRLRRWDHDRRFWLAPKAVEQPPAAVFRQGASEEDYVLQVRPGAVTAEARGPAGLFYAAQTLAQLIRANRHQDHLPALVVRDWPSFRWRCFQDDMTRGPSSTLATLQREVALGALLKMNLFTYYMEYQYAFRKHPDIGPPDGSLQPEELVRLVDFARLYHVQILGNQQSFGHFGRILRHEKYRHLRETPSLLTPVREETYQLLDDLYSEVCPLLPFPMFNVCCDETWGLGQGPSRKLAAEIGVGGVYVRHIRRIHDLLREKYNKRMMMWGDIILRHPDKLDQIPNETVMLTWGYAARESFEDQIIPFARSGYEFFVCPGISNWSRILPDFGVAMTNIRNFVRDGAKHGALGVLNTAWEDDGEALQGYKWHGYAWGAECAWNASTTEPDDFNRRVGAVLFGEKEDHFGQAIELLAQTHRLPGMGGMNNRRFWEEDFRPRRPGREIERSARQLLGLVRPAIQHLETCRQQATAHADLLDRFLFGARRMERIGQRMLDGLQVARLYGEAFRSAPERAAGLLREAEKLVEGNRRAHRELGRRFEQLWLAESKPYALAWTLGRYEELDQRYAELAQQLAAARTAAEAGKSIPPPEKLQLALPQTADKP